MTKATFSTDNAPLSPAPCRPSEGTRFPSRAPGSQPRLPPAVPAAETANERFCQDVTHRPPQPEQPEDKPQTRRRGPEAPEGPSPAARAGLRGPRAAGVPAHPRSPLLRVLGPLLPRPRGATDHQLLGPTEPRLGPRPGGGGSPPARASPSPSASPRCCTKPCSAGGLPAPSRRLRPALSLSIKYHMEITRVTALL